MSHKRVVVLLCSVLSLLLATMSISAEVSNAEAVSGIWVLHQFSSVEDLRKSEALLRKALSFPGVRGLCIRAPWNAVDENFDLFDAGKKIADEQNVDFTVRFMAGRHTPARIFDDGAAYYVTSRGEKGEKVPAPVMPDGSFNVIFEKNYEEFVSKLAAWCRKNNVHLLHLAWYGEQWAELNHGVSVRSLPGYTYDRWFDAHTRLIDIGLKYSGDDLAVELPFSGHGPTGDTTSAFADHVWKKIGAYSDRFFFQANGWRPEGVFGSPTQWMEQMKGRAFKRPVCRGLQMIQPKDYDWKETFDHLYELRATYGEIYTPSFAMAHADQLREEIQKFSDYCSRLKGPKPNATDLDPRAEGRHWEWSLIDNPEDLMSPVSGNEEAIRGTWVYETLGAYSKSTTDTVTQIQSARKNIEKALQVDGVRGLSVRVPWRLIDGDYTILDEALEIARANRKEIMLHVMAGKFSPDRVFSESNYYKVGQDRIPAPFDIETGEPNVKFETAYEDFVAHLALWCRGNGVRLLHLAWYSQGWDELNHGKEVQSLKGYSRDAWLNAHKRLMDFGIAQTGRSLSIAFPFTGYGASVDDAVELGNHVIEKIGENNDRFFFQANGWGHRGEQQVPSADKASSYEDLWKLPLHRGLQAMFSSATQPVDLDWEQFYGIADEIDASYVEIFATNFFKESFNDLQQQMREFGKQVQASTHPTKGDK